MLDVNHKKLNFIALATMPLVAVFSSSIAIEVDIKSIATIFAINLIPMLVSSGIGYLLLGNGGIKYYTLMAESVIAGKWVVWKPI